MFFYLFIYFSFIVDDCTYRLLLKLHPNISCLALHVSELICIDNNDKKAAIDVQRHVFFCFFFKQVLNTC